MPHTVVLPLNYIHLFKLLIIQDSNLDPNIRSIMLYQIELFEQNKKFLEILGFEPKITICKIAVLPIKLYPLFKLLIIQDSNLDPNIGSIMPYRWTNKKYTLLILVLFTNKFF